MCRNLHQERQTQKKARRAADSLLQIYCPEEAYPALRAMLTSDDPGQIGAVSERLPLLANGQWRYSIFADGNNGPQS